MLKGMDSVIIGLFIIVALIWLGVITKYLFSNKTQKNPNTKLELKPEEKNIQFTPEFEQSINKIKKSIPHKPFSLDDINIDGLKFPIGILLGILIAELPPYWICIHCRNYRRILHFEIFQKLLICLHMYN